MASCYVELDEHNPFDITKLGGLRPPSLDVRYINQSGCFTIHPKPTKPLEHIRTLKCVFRSEIKEEIKWQLRKLEVHSNLIYPSLESLSQRHSKQT